MSFFDNWRVQVAMTKIGKSQSEIDNLEREYHNASETRKEEIFDIYKKDIDKGLIKEIINTDKINNIFNDLPNINIEKNFNNSNNNNNNRKI